MSYDADEILGRMRADDGSDWPTRLSNDLQAAPLVAEHDAHFGRSRSSEPLTANQELVLAGISRGLTETEIADVTAISVVAVRDRLRECRRKLAGKTSAHAACNAVRQGLIP